MKAILRDCDVKTTDQKWNTRDYELSNILANAQYQVHARLADNFDTPGAIDHLSEIVTATNSYIQ